MKRVSDNCEETGEGESNGIKNTWGSFEGKFGRASHYPIDSKRMRVQEGHEYEGKAHFITNENKR